MTYNNENGTIRPRTFSNMELGCLYCPHLTPAMASRRLKEWIIYNPTLVEMPMASRRLKEWIIYNPTLVEMLKESGWNPRNRIYTPHQVACIFKILGEP